MLVGSAARDDAAVYRLSDALALVLTVDYFTPVVDDPYDFGRIAAANALSDVYAMGARPALALNLVGFPARDLPLELLGEILRGGADIAREAGIAVAGGHSIDDAEPKYGMVALGFVHPNRLLRNVGARPGDRLVLTKPLGIGIIATAIKRQQAPPEMIHAAVRTMVTLNAAASEAALRAEAHACTDVTGFGLLGHLREMMEGSGVGARLEAGQVPFLEGVAELAQAGAVPGGTRRNYASLSDVVHWPESMPEWQRLMLADAQTSGGLLIAVSPDRAPELVAELREAGTPASAVIGEVVEGPPGRILVE